MAKQAKAQTHEFQTEVSQLLHLMIHSLYSNKEIFLRELISNASDACDKLRFEALSNADLYENDSELAIKVDFDAEAGTVTITDNGIGMNHDEIIQNIGTIAKSGTKQFFESLTGDQAKDASLIGQFGVGFYSSFIVADKVTVISRRAGDAADQAVIWESTGDGSFTTQEATKEQRGTEIVLHLKEDEKEFANDWRLRSTISRYSDHINLPVMMLKVPEPPAEGEEAPADVTPEWEQINKASALWTRAKNEIKDEEYQEFYKSLSHDFNDAMSWSHNRVEGKYEYTSLFYIPKQAPFDLWDRDKTNGIKLYVQRVFIMDDADKLLPKYLRFVKGLVDSNDLPLNVSREILQSNKVIDSIRSGSVKKVLGLIEKLAKNDAEKFAEFWTAFGQVLKEGVAEDMPNQSQIASLLRFASNHEDSLEKAGTQDVSLEQYIERMVEGQDKIYYVTADTWAAAKNSPHLEVFKKRGIEVLLMTDRVDEWMMQYLNEFDEKQFVSIAKGDLELKDLGNAEEDTKTEEDKQKETDLVERIKKALGDKVEDVKVSERLTESPACVVLSNMDMALHMQRLMAQAGHEVPESKPVLEINPAHGLLVKVAAENDDARFAEWSELILDQSVLAAGGQLKDPAEFVKLTNKLLAA